MKGVLKCENISELVKSARKLSRMTRNTSKSKLSAGPQSVTVKNVIRKFQRELNNA